MTKRPLSLLIISYIFIAAGIIGILYHAPEFDIHHPFEYNLIVGLFVRLIAIIGGVFLLRGENWARWLLVVWIIYHVVLSFYHSFSEILIHSLLFVAVTFFLFRPKVTEYFERLRVQRPKTGNPHEGQ